jgi:5-methylcytosine-specific restriction endonuclease McrA
MKIPTPRLTATNSTLSLPPRGPKRADPIYSDPRWRREVQPAAMARAGYRCEWPNCESPLRCQCRENLVADHIVEINDGGERFDISNVMVMCRQHHAEKTLAARQRRARW